MKIEYNKNKPLRVFNSFAGYNSQLMALQRLKDNFPDFDFECVGWSEIDKNAIAAHNACFPNEKDKNYGDISKIDWEKVPDFDLFTMSSPCFIKGTLVLTDKGYKEIQDVKVGDKVLTHNNRYQVVERVGHKVSDDIYRIKSMVSPETICSGNHPFYVRRFRRINKKVDGKIKSVRQFSNPEWVEARELNNNCYLGYAINTESRLPMWDGVINNMWGHNKRENIIKTMLSKPQFWYLMGRYVGDGWKKTSKTSNSIVVCCGGRYEDNLVNAISELGFNYTKVNERTVRKYIISRNELYKFVDRFGYYAHGKHIDGETLDLPPELLKYFLDGIMESDGCYTQNTYKVTSVSKELVYGIAAIVAKVYKSHPRIYYFERKPKCVIEGREVNQRSSWTVCWHTDRRKQDHAFYEDGVIWFPLKKICKLDIRETVYNIQVADDHSYTANGAIVHNCQDFSLSGKRMGGEEGSGTRSSLLWECTKAIDIKRPRYVFFENVKGLITGAFIKGFHKWQARLEDFGYSNFTQVLNAKDYGVPQNRERVFMVSILRTENEPNPSYYFPKPFNLETRIKDVLEKEVDESFYLSDKALEYFCSVNNDNSHEPRITGVMEEVEPKIIGYSRDKNGNVVSRHLKEVANTVHTFTGGGWTTDQFVAEPIIAASRGRGEGWNQQLEINESGTSNAITSTAKDNYVMEQNLKMDNGCLVDNEGRRYRIRKLTPRECFRLMDVKDEDIDKIQQAGIAKTNQFKLAGNSIVVSPMYHIFRKMFVEKENENQQLELF